MTAIIHICRASIIAVVGAALLGPRDSQAQAIGPDFNDDGFADLPIGVPFESIGNVQNAGAVNLFHGSASRLTSAGNQFWHQNKAGVLDDAEANDQFGRSLAWADFDGDGYDDLAIGSPFEKIGVDSGAGAVSVLYGSHNGLSFVGDQFWHQDVAGVTDNAEQNDHFGSSLTTGDFNHDGFGDLVVGVPNEGIGIRAGCGAVHVLYGSTTGLRASGSRFFHQDTAGMAGVAGANDGFGSSLEPGDFDGDGFDDLAIGIPGKGITEGALQVMYGTPIGLLVVGNRVFHRAHLPAGATQCRFGSSLAAGDFDGDGSDDLAVGMPTSVVSGLIGVGAVGVFYGSDGSGLGVSRSELWHQNSPGVEGGPVSASDDYPAEQFGWCVAAGDFDADGYAELAISEPGDMTCGSVHVLIGSAAGLTAAGSLYLHQDTPFMPGGNLKDDLFGWSMALGDFDGDSIVDLVIGVPGENVLPGVNDAGAVIVLFGSDTGLHPWEHQYWTQNIAGILDIAEANDRFAFGSLH